MAGGGAGSVVNGTPLRRDRAAVPAPLPDEVVQWEILVRVPGKELLRCRAACRSWRRLASDAAFLTAHHRRQPSLPLVFFRTRSNDYAAHAVVDALDIRRTPAARRPVLGFDDYNKSRRSFTIHASCDGLLLLSLSNHRFYICNPATRQWLQLPDLTGGSVAALYPHRPSSDYRVLFWKYTDNKSCRFAYYVLTVSSLQGQQRCIGLPVASPSMTKDRSWWHLQASEHPPLLLHDCLHWHAFNSKIVIFDTVAESFSWVQSPTATSSAHLLQMDGMLGIGCIDTATMTAKAWVLEDYEAEVWSSKYRTELPEEEMMEDGKCVQCLYGKVVSEKGDMLLIGRICWSLSLFHCDNKGELIQKFLWENVDPKLLGISFKESLVRHPFFQRKDGSRVRLPRFLRGL
ncbi:hypothetical protein ACQJBY_029962 [Aegilops geniculata]